MNIDPNCSAQLTRKAWRVRLAISLIIFLAMAVALSELSGVALTWLLPPALVTAWLLVRLAQPRKIRYRGITMRRVESCRCEPCRGGNHDPR